MGKERAASENRLQSGHVRRFQPGKRGTYKGAYRKAFASFCAILLAAFFTLATCAPVQAAEAYTYTVRIFAGQQGTIGGGEVLVYDNLQYGERISFNQRDVALNDNSKYYIRGVRESGKDNNTIRENSFLVTSDRDYVVAYGILGDAVAYTVNYVDADGNALAPSETYYGNIGDKPVIAYLYIDGYQPQAYNLGLTLSANAADNVFTFIYTPVEEPAAPPLTPEEPEGGEAAANPEAGTNPDAGAAGADAGAGAGAGADAGAAGAGAGADAGTTIPDEEVPLEGPLDYQDLDDEEVPLADVDAGTGEAFVRSEDYAKLFGNLPGAALIGLFSLGAASGALLYWYFLIFRRRKKEEAS